MHHRCNVTADRNISEAKSRFLFWTPTNSAKKKLGVQPRSHSSSVISDVTSPVKLVMKICYRTRFQASSGNSDSMNRPGYEAAWSAFRISFTLDWKIDNGFLTGQSWCVLKYLVHRWGPRTRILALSCRDELFKARLVLNPGLNLTQVSFSCVQKHFLG